MCFFCYIGGVKAQVFNDLVEDSVSESHLAAEPQVAYYTGSMSKVDSLLAFSRKFIGTPYRYGGTTPRGFDCSGFMVHIFSNFDVKLPRTATQQYNAHSTIKRDNLRRGDLVFFSSRSRDRRIGHVGVVIEEPKEAGGVYRFIHSSTSRGVIISKSTEPYYASRYVGACRVIHPIKFDASKIVSYDEKKHTVAKKETLHSIAKKYGIATDSIRSWNKIEGKSLKVGQELIVAKVAKKDSPTLPKEHETATKSDDKALLVRNKEKEKEKEKPAKDEEKSSITHTVKKGDTLYGIAKKHNTTVNKIKKDNKLTSNGLRIGQKLMIK